MHHPATRRSYQADIEVPVVVDSPARSPVSDLRSHRRDVGASLYEAAFVHSLDALLLSSPDGPILAANESACELLGMTEDEIIAAGRAGIADPADERLCAALDERQRQGHVQTELEMRRGDGAVFLANIASAIFETEDGPRAYVLVRDATGGAVSAKQPTLPVPLQSTPHAAGEPLSKRELTVVTYLAARMTYREIASDLYISVNTVKSHVHAIYRKLGTSSRSDAVATADALGLLLSPPPRTAPGMSGRTHEYAIVCACGNRWRLNQRDKPAHVVCAVCGAQRPRVLDLGQIRPD